jgi:hypothetical protein
MPSEVAHISSAHEIIIRWRMHLHDSHHAGDGIGLYGREEREREDDPDPSPDDHPDPFLSE